MSQPAPDLRALVAGAQAILEQAGVASPGHDARALAAHALGLARLDYLIGVDVPEDFPRRYAELVERRRTRQPLQHIVGWTGFRRLDLEVRPGVFVPRPETEIIAGHAIDALRALGPQADPVVADLCCGAGPIAIAIAQEVPRARVLAVDASPEAVDLTRANALRCGVDDRVVAWVGDVADPDLMHDVAGRLDLLVANPPYIPPDAVPRDAEVREHDPDLALYGGGVDGLDVPRAVVRAAARLVRPGGTVVMEHAEVQAEEVRTLAAAAGFEHIRTVVDLAGRDRGLLARVARSSS